MLPHPQRPRRSGLPTAASPADFGVRERYSALRASISARVRGGVAVDVVGDQPGSRCPPRLPGGAAWPAAGVGGQKPAAVRGVVRVLVLPMIRTPG